MSLLTVVKWRGLVVVSAIEVVHDGVDFFVVLGDGVVVCGLVGGFLVEGFAGIVLLLSDRVSGIIFTNILPYRSTATLRYYRM